MMEEVKRAMCGVNEIEQAMATSTQVGRSEGKVLVNAKENLHKKKKKHNLNLHENLNKNLHEQM